MRPSATLGVLIDGFRPQSELPESDQVHQSELPEASIARAIDAPQCDEITAKSINQKHSQSQSSLRASSPVRRRILTYDISEEEDTYTKQPPSKLPSATKLNETKSINQKHCQSQSSRQAYFPG
jgi:hypothetical protein